MSMIFRAYAERKRTGRAQPGTDGLDDAAKQAGIHVIHIHSLPLWKKILYGTAFIGFLMLLAVAVWFAFVGFGAILAVAALVYVVSRLFR